MSDVVPQWKKELIARLQSRRIAQAQNAPETEPEQSQQLFSGSERPLASSSTASIGSSAVQVVSSGRQTECECENKKMVQQETNESDEDLHYGPGIVSKLKERYLSLAQREKAVRPTVLRKAASLENILDDEPPKSPRIFMPRETRAVSRFARKGSDLKRARSVEAISQNTDREGKELNRKSMHEDILIKGSLIIPAKPTENGETYTKPNRPKRLAPLLNEREKPPVDVVKQTKKIFERRSEQRTKALQPTGEVAAKVATYKSIIGQNKPKKPAIKAKPVIDKPKTNGIRVKTKDHVAIETPRPLSPEKKAIFEGQRPKTPEDYQSPKSPERNIFDFSMKNSKVADLPSPKSPILSILSPKSPEKSLPSPIPDISRIDFKAEENGKLSETPDLIVTSTPLPVNSPSFKISATENFIKEEIRLSHSALLPSKSPPPTPEEPLKKSAPSSPSPISPISTTDGPEPPTKLPTNKNVSNTHTPPSQPLKLEINGIGESKNKSKVSPSSEQVLVSSKPALTSLEIEKNLINTVKTLQQPKSSNSGSVITKCASEVTVNKVPKVKKQSSRDFDSGNSIVIDFTHRKDKEVPDYVRNDGINRAAKPDKPKVGDGGIILLPGASVGESFTDEDDEVLRSLEGPPSPCDVTFINDNVLIDGKSSLSQKTKKAKLKISFVDKGPEVFEYPSESSLLIDEMPSPQIRNSVPSISGSSLANYTPKSTEDFQPGISRSVQNVPVVTKQEIPETSDLILQEAETPILFSAGTNSDILF